MGNQRRLPEAAAAADLLLVKLGRTQRELHYLQAEMEREMTRLRESWQARLAPLEERQEQMAAALLTLAKEHKEELFRGESCRLDLPHGALLYEVQRRVKRVRGLLDRLKEQGFLEAIKVAESVDWDRLEAWPEERLRQVGTKRVVKEVFGYEVKEA